LARLAGIVHEDKSSFEFRPHHARDFLAPLPGQDEHPHDGVEWARPIGRFPHGGELGVGKHALARGDARQA